MSETDLLPDLLPCPFCGKPPRLELDTPAAEFSVECEDELCAAFITAGFRSEAAAIAAWNTRSARPAVSEDVVSEREQMKVLLPPASIDNQDYLDGWCDGQAYLILNYGTEQEFDAAVKVANELPDLLERIATALHECSAQIHEDGLSVWHRYARVALAAL